MKKKCISKEWLFSYNGEKEATLIDLPHDYSINQKRNEKSLGAASNGFFDGTCGKYLKYITLEDDEHVILDIDGSYMCTRVSLNENQLCFHPYGYTPFLVDLTPKMRKNRPNKLVITNQNLQPSTRWYSGAGLYRDVFLWTGGKVRIEPWDIFIKTESIEENSAKIIIEAEISSDLDAKISLNCKITAPDGKIAVQNQAKATVKIGKNPVTFSYEIKNPALWDLDFPNLYNLCLEISCDNKIEDVYDKQFGVRTISATPEHGLLLNGKPLKLQGGCIHHDHGALGAAAFPAAEYRKLSKLKAAGFNAIRSAHNPPSLSMLELCDRMGIVVMDEAFDMWNVPKHRLDYSMWFADWWERDLKSMVLRDRNHPCVFSYSIGNEIVERNCWSDGDVWSQRLSDKIREYDNTRFVTSGICCMYVEPDENAPLEYIEDFKKDRYNQKGEGNDPDFGKWTEAFMKPLDIVGYNYYFTGYECDHKTHPERIMWGSESRVLSFYHSWQAVMKNNHVLGDFTWTAYDNLGEAGAGRFLWEREGAINGISLGKYPWRTCYQGDFDITGFRRPQSYFREAVWKKDCEPKIFTTNPVHNGERFSGTGWHWHDVCDTWTFDDRYIGTPVNVEVYTDADEIRFILNGTPVGAAKPFNGMATAEIPYEKGILKAVSYKDGKEINSSELKTVEKAEMIKIVPEKTEFSADNRDLCYFEIYITDKNGERVPLAENELSGSCSGGELICIFGANPKNEDEYGTNKCHAFFGRAVAVVKTKNPGNITLTVKGEGLKSGAATVFAK